MGRMRALSFISDRLNNRKRIDSTPDPATAASSSLPQPPARTSVIAKRNHQHNQLQTSNDDAAPPLPPPHHEPSSNTSSRASPVLGVRRTDRSAGGGRPPSAIYPSLPLGEDATPPEAPPELEPILGHLNNQTNKLYYEGYLLRLNDLDNQGRPYTERQWVECFAQLIGSVLWMWDAAALDEAGSTGDVHPSHINIADATIKMVEALPTRFADNQPLQNVLSLSTAGKNRYLLHFNSLNSLTQWTAAIRLTMYENTQLQEAYTGALIAGKGKSLNNMKAILERTRFKYEDWVQVRFSPGTPWKRCWCVISPPDEKAIQKAQRAVKKKKQSSYDRPASQMKGNIKFYQTAKTKKVKPLVTITDAYSAFAIYPQSRPLVEQSTLVKLEGHVKIHSKVETSTEGFVFVMPELHPAVSGLEIMLRWLFPVYDTFGLYGRPTRLLADTASSKSLMFAMPQGSRSMAYLDNLDVSNLIHTEGSDQWSEEEWRRRLKEATSRRVAAKSSSSSRDSSRRASHLAGQRSSFPRTTPSVRFGDKNNKHDNNNNNGVAPRLAKNHSSDAVFRSGKTDGVAANPGGHETSENYSSGSNVNGYGRWDQPSGNSLERVVPEEAEEYSSSPRRPATATATAAAAATGAPPQPPPHGPPQYDGGNDDHVAGGPSPRSSNSSGSSGQHYPHNGISNPAVDQFQPSPQPSPVARPPAFAHSPGDTPPNKPQPSPDLKRANSRVSYGTLSQMAEMSRREGMATASSATAAAPPAPVPAVWNSQKQQAPPTEPAPKQPDGVVGGGLQPHDGSLPLANNNINNPHSPITPLSPVSPLPNEHGSNSPGRNAGGRPLSQDSPVSPPKAVTARKPVPQQAPPDVETRSRTMTSDSSSLGSLRHTIDMDALNNVVTRDRSPPPPHQRREVQVQDDDSVYDQASVSSPDYASSHKSSVSKHSASSSAQQKQQRPRIGVKKTVGTPDAASNELMIGDARFQRPAEATAPNPDLPLVDFGPTHSYNPMTAATTTARRPSTSETLTMFGGGGGGAGHDRNKSDGTLGPNNDKKAGSSPSPGRSTPVGGERNKNNNNNRRTESPAHEERRRSVLWQPGMVPEGRRTNSPGPRLTPEQYVHQRADGERVASPTYNHRRGPSQASPRPRPVSGDWTTFNNNNRRSSPNPRDMTARPHSRGASVTLNHSELSPQLSAREREHVARVTGSSFFNLNNNSNNNNSNSSNDTTGGQQPSQMLGSGLVSAIDARERERQAMKEGVSGQMVQQAIAQRQHQSQFSGVSSQPQLQPQYQYAHPQAHSPPPPPHSPPNYHLSYQQQQPPQYRQPQAPAVGIPYNQPVPYPQQQQQQQQFQWNQQAQPSNQPPLYAQAPPPPAHQGHPYYR